jgi:YD repeat-containing protein
MDVIRLGPLIIPLSAVLSVLGILAATTVADWLRRRRGVDAGAVLWRMIVVGFVAARAVFVLKHHDIYLQAPWTALDIRDGGFEGVAGLIAACVVGAELTRRQASLRRPLLASVLAGCAVWIGGTLAAQALAPPRSPLPDLMVRQLDGQQVALRSFGGRPLVINLWATWCPPCRREMPALQSAQAAYPELGFVFVNQGESATMVRRYLATQQLRLQNVVIDPAGQLAARTGAAGYPTTLFYDASGRLRLRHVGELSEATLKEKLALIQP